MTEKTHTQTGFGKFLDLSEIRFTVKIFFLIHVAELNLFHSAYSYINRNYTMVEHFHKKKIYADGW